MEEERFLVGILVMLINELMLPYGIGVMEFRMSDSKKVAWRNAMCVA